MSVARLVTITALSALGVSVFVAINAPASWPFTLPPLAFFTLWSVRLAHRET